MKIDEPCLAPWHALTIKSNGSVAPDTLFSGTYGNVKDKSFKDLYNSPVACDLRNQHRQHHFPQYCQTCEKKQKSTGRSRKTYFSKNLKKHIRGEFFPDDHENPNIIYLELNFSNKCNLKCRMCSGHVSTSWIQEELKLQKLSQRTYKRKYKPSYREVELKNVTQLFSDKENFKHLKVVALRGGEPLIEERNFQFLDFLIDKGLSQNIILNISTNGTKFDPRLQYYCEKFENIEIYISLEGVGEVYEYIRGGKEFKFRSLEDNIKLFQGLNNRIVAFTVTIMAYNIFSINEIWDWYSSVRLPGDEIVFSNVVVEPNYLNFQILPKNLRTLAANSLDQRDYPRGDYFSGKRWTGDIGILPLKTKLLSLDNENNLMKLKQFTEFTNDLDQIRGTKVVDCIPQLKEIFIK